MSVIEGVKSALEAVYDIQNAESILIVHDDIKEGIADIFEDAVRKSKSDIPIERFDIGKYRRPIENIPRDLINLIDKVKPDITITLFEAYPNERPMRINLLTMLEFYGKIAHCPGITEDMLRKNGPLDVNYMELKQTAERLKSVLKEFQTFKVFSGPNYKYELDIYVDNRKWLDDLTVKDRDMGNLPAGEVFIGPIEDAAEGKMYVEHRAGEYLLPQPVIVTWKKGRVVKIESEDKKIEKILWDEIGKIEYNDMIGELGIGFNPNANPTSPILEAEKRGLHIARGPSREFGSSYGCEDHEDYLVINSKLIGIKRGNFKKLYERGRLLV